MAFLGTIGIYFLVAIFVVGMAGSTIVVLISFVEDFREFFGSEETLPMAPSTPSQTHEYQTRQGTA
jgi:hypothetical protein